MMISDGETRISEPHQECSHSFPRLNKGALIDPADAAGEPDDCFKPLFGNPRIDGNQSSHTRLGIASPGKELNSEDSVRRKSFDLGFDAGRQDACTLAQGEMAPQIKLFADLFSRWNAAMIRIAENSNLQILKMAAAIAERILGSPPQCCSGRLESLKSDLIARLHQAYQLEFKLNPMDMDALSELMACENVHWKQLDYVTATGDEAVPRGSLRMQPGTRNLLADDGILRSLDITLSEVSTK
jgi:hypothetical protein